MFIRLIFCFSWSSSVKKEKALYFLPFCVLFLYQVMELKKLCSWNRQECKKWHTLIWSSISIFSHAIIAPASSARTVYANDTPVSLTPSCWILKFLVTVTENQFTSYLKSMNTNWTCKALWTGAAPRYNGSKLGCILTVPMNIKNN